METLEEIEKLNYITSLAEKGDLVSQRILGEYYESGEESEYWYKKAAKQGDAESQYMLWGNYIHKGETFHKEALYWLQMAANQNYYMAQAELGNLYYEGIIVPQSYEKAVNYYEKCVDNIIIDKDLILYRLAYCYYYGNGVKQSYEKSRFFLIESNNYNFLKKDCSNEQFKFPEYRDLLSIAF